ncbi:hypothetical protein SBA4_6690002 [Candidatus Sulfopaludibacter sp. SbA4]|nr:hypothetical protein SBA4_6690002 [Candidatus Sulfopaludibacter sp. SbA4]
MSDTGYDVFISYSNKDAEFVTRLSSGLRDNGCTTFSFLDVLAGDDWVVETKKALIASRFIVVVLSEAYSTSRWAESEWIQGMQREQSESRTVVLPVRLAEESGSGLAPVGRPARKPRDNFTSYSELPGRVARPARAAN